MSCSRRHDKRMHENANACTQVQTQNSTCPVLILESNVAQNYDFGTVYAYLCPYWNEVATIQHTLRNKEEEDREIRRKVFIQDRIPMWNVQPQRVWDLYANRVVPYWVADDYPWGISHAWVDKKDHMDVMTPINGYEWPVPMPKDANLDLIRIEMLNLGVEYAWLDVLRTQLNTCMQMSNAEFSWPKGEHLRVEEWKLDVPTIGWVYRPPPEVVCYLNRLGRPLHLTLGDFESDRCWFRRTWTLQEITDDAIIAGETGDDVMEKEVQKMFDEQLARLRKIREWSFALELVSEMWNWVSTKSLDKVAGLAYLLYPEFIPIYDAEKSDANAWEVLIDAMSPVCRAEFFYFPEPGMGRKCWRPSWRQIMMLKHSVPYSFLLPGKVDQTEGTDADWYEGYCIHSADVRGLDDGLKEEKPRQGEMVFNDATGLPHTLKLVATHTYPIPDGLYALIGCSFDRSSDVWVIGW
ncbi:hypothetical protein EV421DRAFT_1940574 [Armillaria borealis]|uniref:Heterokaryon incompatibility domain-containing protein n=1 Tax=Armillaria borealis TaxID=47425 RepID=A0AA39MCL8_9AGAR|nr:hypothetical protein EV421DRAFT_1940574 [Armillaria borealis]